MPFSKYGAIVYIVVYSNPSYKDKDCGVLFYVSEHYKNRMVEELKAGGFMVSVKEVTL